MCKDGLSVCNLYVHTVCGDITGQRSLCPPARTHINAHTHINVSLLVYQDKRADQSQKLVTQWCHWADEEMASEEFDVIHLHHSPSVLLCAFFSNFHFLSFTCFPSSLVPSVQELRKLCSNSCLNKHDDNRLSTLQICVFIDMFPITWYVCNEQGEPNCRASQLYEAGGCKKIL